jgi:hypothetical protein
MSKTLERSGVLEELPTEKQAVVKAFSEVIRKHRSQNRVSLAQLASLAFALTLGARATRQEKLALAVARGMESRQKLAEAEGGSLSSEEVARLLRISKTAVLKRLEAGRLLAWREERLQAARFPGWQLDQHGQVLAGLEDVLECLNRDPGLDVWGKILFFLQTNSRLGGQRPLDGLREGKVQAVCRAAQAYAE